MIAKYFNNLTNVVLLQTYLFVVLACVKIHYFKFDLENENKQLPFVSEY